VNAPDLGVLPASFAHVQPNDIHIGLQAENLSQACNLLSAALGISWAEPVGGWPVQVRMAGRDELEESEGRFTLSRQGPPYLELGQNVPGSPIWHSDGQPISVHHLGFWVEDVEAASARLSEAGFPFEAGGLAADGQLRYAYHQVGGMRIEVCERSARDAFDRWGRTGDPNGATDVFMGAEQPAEPQTAGQDSELSHTRSDEQ